MPFVLLVLGIYAIAVAVHGNTAKLSTDLVATMSGFVVWLVALVILSIWSSTGPEASRKVGKAFFVLAMVGFILANGTGLIAQSQKFIAFVKGGGSGSAFSSNASTSSIMNAFTPSSASLAAGNTGSNLLGG